MARLTHALLLIMALLAIPVWAGINQEDFTPNLAGAGPVAPPPPSNNPWTVIFNFDASAAVGGNLHLHGVAFAGGHFWATGAGQSLSDPSDNLIYKFTPAGVLVNTYPQPNVGDGYGFYDLAFDGVYLYGVCGGPYLYAFDLNGQMVPSMNVPKPQYSQTLVGVGYDLNTDHFWVSNSTDLYEITRTGSVLWSGYAGVVNYITGLAFDYSTYGPWVWLFCEYGNPNSTFVKFNPITHALAGETHGFALPGMTSQNSAGLDITREYDASLWTLVGMQSGLPGDHIFVDELHNYLNPYAPAAPTNMLVENTGPLPRAKVTWNNPTLDASGHPLVSINYIAIRRSNVPIDTVLGNPGQAMTYYNDVPSPNTFSYQVRCVNDSGVGATAAAYAWIGLDVPNFVTNQTGTGVGTSLIAHITWTNPTTGQHNGYFTPDSISSYTINRYDQVGQLQATFNPAGPLTSYDDSTITEPDWYSYGIIPVDHSGSGYERATSMFQVGPTAFVVVPYNWVEIKGIGVNTGILARDQNVGPFSLGFDYHFYGATFNTIRICSNGFASFTSASASHDFVQIPAPSEPNNLIAPFWTYLWPHDYNGEVWYYPDYTNRRFIVEWDSLAADASWMKELYPVKFEAIIYANGYIDFMYNLIPWDTQHESTVGIENGAGSQGVQCSYSAYGPFVPNDSTGVRIVTQHIGISDVEVTLTPLVSPILIPANGGSFSYYATLTNAGLTPQSTTLWIKEILPDSSVLSPLLGPITINVPAGTRAWFRNQNVPGSAPPGQYTYIGVAGVYPDTIWSQDSFPFTKLTTGNGPRVDNWDNWGDSFTETPTASVVVPLTFALHGAHPNPFNPTTTLSYQLPADSRVSLRVFDTTGRLVTTLVEGWQEAGQHQTTFDGSHLSSGVYLICLKAGAHQASSKMVLLK